jgi:hypothetical protein
MLLILTYFHMYWRNIVLRDIYMKHKEMESKCATRKAQNKQIRRRAHLTIQSGPNTSVDMSQAHPTTD